MNGKCGASLGWRFLSQLVVVFVAFAAVSPLLSRPAAAAIPTSPDGVTAATAGASCWAIKQAYPSSPTGVYWVLTQTLGAPEQFYCDMTTEGGGWVLVGRGREGWTFSPHGQNSAADVSSTPSGPSAFPPAALSAKVIDGLLDGTRVSDLNDGVLLRRASAADGSAFQSVRWRLLNIKAWTWAFPGGNLLGSTQVNGNYFTGGNTKDPLQPFPGQVGPGTGSDNGWLRVFTYPWASHGNKAGFSYGSSVSGSNSASTYLWTQGTERHAVPFTQVYIRPQITAVSPGAIPDGGLPARTQRPLLSTRTEPLSGWGVTGLLKVGDSEPAVDAQVLAFAQIGNTIYVGGKFANVQQGAASTAYAQPYLAAFDKNTGAWRQDFRPTLDGTVWDLGVTPEGRLVVGGQFTNVNGQPGTAGLALLDPATGGLVAGWRAGLGIGDSSIRPWVRALDVQGSWVYVAGNFTSITGPSGAPLAMGRMGRVRVATGEPDRQFRPNVSGVTYDLDATPDRVYIVGTFDYVDGAFVNNVAALHPQDGSLVTGLQPWRPTASRDYQQTILEVGDNVFQGGSEHNLQVYDRRDYTLRKSFVTADSGGDFQALAVIGGVVYGAGHFTRYAYTDAVAWPTPTGFTRADKALYIGAWDAQTFEYLPEFLPALGSANTEGPWELFVDSDQCMWFGGDLNRGSSGQWLGGFGKYCARDVTAPTVPAAPETSVQSTGVTLRWGRSTDAGPYVRYEVLRNDRVIAGGVSTTSFTDPVGKSGDRYFVRAIDSVGNRSASTKLVSSSDTQAPTVPKNLTGTANGSDVRLDWTASTDNVGVTGYAVWQNGVEVAQVPGPTATVTGLTARTWYFQVQALDAAGNRSAKTASVAVTVTG